MKTLAMGFITARITNILGDHEYRARCAVHEAWISGKITAEQDSVICAGITEMFGAVVEAIQQCQTPDEIDQVMQRFESAARALVHKYNLPCEF